MIWATGQGHLTIVDFFNFYRALYNAKKYDFLGEICCSLAISMDYYQVMTLSNQ